MGRLDDLHDCSSDLRRVCILPFEGSQPFQDNVGNGCRGTLGVLLGAQLIGGRAGVQEVVGTFGEGAWHNDGGFDTPAGTSPREAIRMGLGVAVLPEWLIEDDLVSGRLVRVLPKWQARELPAHVVYPAQRRLPLRVGTSIDFAVNYMSTVLKPDKR
jgi:DNA-binding transcriptional LysR family regulator